MQTAFLTGREKNIQARNREHPHPACREVAFRFGTRRNNYADTLCGRIRALYRYAEKHCRDGYLTKAEAVKVLAVGAQMRTGHNRLADLLLMSTHFALGEGEILLLKTQFLSATKREDAIARWHRRKDGDAERKRGQRSAMITRTVCRRRKFGPPDTRQRLFGDPGPMSRAVRKTFKAIFSSMSDAQNENQEHDPTAEVAPLKEGATVAEKQAHILAITEAQDRAEAVSKPKPKPKPKPIARDENGVPLCFYRLGFKYFPSLWARYSEDIWWQAYHKVKNSDRLGPDRGAAMTYAAGKLARNEWKRAI